MGNDIGRGCLGGRSGSSTSSDDLKKKQMKKAPGSYTSEKSVSSAPSSSSSYWEHVTDDSRNGGFSMANFRMLAEKKGGIPERYRPRLWRAVTRETRARLEREAKEREVKEKEVVEVVDAADVDMDSTTTNNDGAATTSRLKPSSFWREDVYDQLLASVAKPSSEEYQRLDLISNEVERERVVREMLLIPREQELNPTQIEEWSRTMKQLHLDLPRNRLITGCVTPERLVSLCTAASVHNPTAGYMQGMDGKELKFCLLFCLCVRCRVAMWINIFLFILHSSSSFFVLLLLFASFCSISSNTITTFK